MSSSSSSRHETNEIQKLPRYVEREKEILLMHWFAILWGEIAADQSKWVHLTKCKRRKKCRQKLDSIVLTAYLTSQYNHSSHELDILVQEGIYKTLRQRFQT